jgi:hypothetical protein
VSRMRADCSGGCGLLLLVRPVSLVQFPKDR